MQSKNSDNTKHQIAHVGTGSNGISSATTIEPSNLEAGGASMCTHSQELKHIEELLAGRNERDEAAISEARIVSLETKRRAMEIQKALIGTNDEPGSLTLLGKCVDRIKEDVETVVGKGTLALDNTQKAIATDHDAILRMTTTLQANAKKALLMHVVMGILQLIGLIWVSHRRYEESAFRAKAEYCSTQHSWFANLTVANFAIQQGVKFVGINDPKTQKVEWITLDQYAKKKATDGN